MAGGGDGGAMMAGTGDGGSLMAGTGGDGGGPTPRFIEANGLTSLFLLLKNLVRSLVVD